MITTSNDGIKAHNEHINKIKIELLLYYFTNTLWGKVKKYENYELGIAFEYPNDWKLVRNCKFIYGVDVLIRKDFTNFGIMKISEKLRFDIISQIKTLEEILNNSIQQNEVLAQDIQSNKYQIQNSESATIMLHKLDKIGNTIQERTLLVQKSGGRIFFIAFEDLPENFESGYNQSLMKNIFNSIKFLWE